MRHNPGYGIMGQLMQGGRVIAFFIPERLEGRQLHQVARRCIEGAVASVLDAGSRGCDEGISMGDTLGYATMHNNFIIVDNAEVELGSFNYTKAAEEKNAENVIVLRNDQAVAKQYQGEWDRLWGESETLAPNY